MNAWLRVIVLLVGFWPRNARGQGRAPESPIPDGRRLRLGTDSLAIYVIRGSDTTRTGVIVDNLSLRGDQLVRIYGSVDAVLGNRLDTIVSRLVDLRPISYRSRSTRLFAQLAYDTTAVVGWLRLVSGDSVAVHVPFTSPMYVGASFDLVARASDLRDGLSLSVPSFLVGSNTIGRLEGHVTGSADVEGQSCWVFKATFESMSVSFWIDKNSRALRRQYMQLRPDFGVLLAPPTPRPSAKRAT